MPAAQKSKQKATKGAGKIDVKQNEMKEESNKQSTIAGIKKEYFKTKNVCRVTFRLPKIAAPDAKNVCIVGDFNHWNMHDNPMKKLKSGDFTLSIELKPGNEYQFRYLIDDVRWENDWNADKYIKNPYGDSDNSVVVV